MVGESEVVVGAEVEDFLAFHLDGCLLRAFYEALLFVESCFANLSERLAEMLFHLSVHFCLGFKVKSLYSYYVITLLRYYVISLL